MKKRRGRRKAGSDVSAAPRESENVRAADRFDEQYGHVPPEDVADRFGATVSTVPRAGMESGVGLAGSAGGFASVPVAFSGFTPSAHSTGGGAGGAESGDFASTMRI